MHADLWWMTILAVFYLGVQLSLGRRTQRDFDEAAMLPFADDPEMLLRIERETGRGINGCSCTGTCDGACMYFGSQEY